MLPVDELLLEPLANVDPPNVIRRLAQRQQHRRQRPVIGVTSSAKLDQARPDLDMSAADEILPPGDPAPELLEGRLWVDGCFDFFHHGQSSLLSLTTATR